MDRCAVLVDAGYLLEAVASLLGGPDSGRRDFRADYSGLSETLRSRAKWVTELPVLRIYWYDAAPERRPSREHREIAMLADVKLRLGNLVRRDDGRWEQKGVDALIHADLVTLARNRAVADIVLVSGDEDLCPAVEHAQEHGVRIQLWGVEAAAHFRNQSGELIATADRRSELGRDWLSPYLELAQPAVPSTEEAGRIEESSGTSLSDGGESAPPACLPEYGSDVAQEGLLGVSAAPTPGHEAENAVEEGTDPYEIGRQYGLRWGRRVHPEQYGRLAEELSARVPASIDPELLHYAEQLGVDTWGDENDKNAVRDGFRSAVRQVADMQEIGIELETSG